MPGLVCSGSDSSGKSGQIKLRPGQEFVLRCTQQEETRIDKTDDIYIELMYDYKETTSQPLLVKRDV